jgi:hypothetical protein
MTGGLLGMMWGTNWIPFEWRTVQDYQYLIQMAEALYSGRKSEASRANRARNTNNTHQAVSVSPDNEWRASPIGALQLIESYPALNSQNGDVVISKWRTEHGQTIFTKEFPPPVINNQPSQQNEQTLITQKPAQLDKSTKSQTLIESKSPKSNPPSKVKQKSLSTQKQLRYFALTGKDITNLLNNPHFQPTLTGGEVLKIILALFDGTKTITTIAKEFDVEEALVNLLSHYVTSTPLIL